MRNVLVRRGPGLGTLLAALWLVGACALPLRPPPAPPRHTSLGLAISSVTLHNGLRVVVVKDPQASEVQVTMRYRVGAADDLENPGIAHLVEHLMFQQVLGSQTLFAHLEEAATFFNAFTTFDATTYVTRAAPDKLDEVLSIEAVRLGFRCTSISDSAFEREREVVTQEVKLRDDSTRLLLALHRAVYPEGHPYRSAIGGSLDSVSAIDRATACKFADAYYAPSNAVLVISGNVTNQRVEVALGKFLARIASRVAAAPAPVPPAPVATRARSEAPAPVDQDTVLVAWPLPTDPELRIRTNAIAKAVAGAVDYGIKGRVQLIELGDVRAPVLGLVVVPGDGESVDDVITVTKDMLDALPATFMLRAVSERIFDSMQQHAIYEQYASLEDGSERDARLAEYALAGRDPAEALAREFRGLRWLRREEAASIARRYLGFERARVVTLTPNEGAKRGHRVALLPASHDMGQRRTPPDPARAHQPAPARSQPAIALRTRVLANGLRVVLVPLATVPTVDARLIFAAGSADEPLDRRGAALVAARSLTWDLHHANDALAFMTAGGTVDVDVDRDRTSFAVRGVDMHLDLLLAGLRRWVCDGTYDDFAETFVDTLEAATKQGDDDGVVTDAWRAALYGAGHPYTTADLVRYAATNLTVEDAERFRAAYFTPDNATLVIAGHFDAALADRWVDFLFADWSGRAQSRRSGPAKLQPASLGKVEDLSQTLVELALPARADDHARRLVAAAMLDEIAGDIRHQLGASYSFGAQALESRLAKELVLAGWIDNTRAAEVVQLLRDRIGQLRADPDQAARAFVTARNRVLTRLAALTGSASALAERVEVDVALGRSPLSDLQTAREVRALTIDDMTDAIAGLDLARAAILIRGPADAVNAGFGVLGRSPTHVEVDGAQLVREDALDGPIASTPQHHHRRQHVRYSDLEAAITEQGPPSPFLLSVSVGYASGTLVNLLQQERGLSIIEDPTGTMLGADVGLRLSRSTTLGLHLGIGTLHGRFQIDYSDPQRYGLVPIDIDAFIQGVGYERFWGGVLGGVHLDGTDTGGDRAWSTGLAIGARGGVDLLRFGAHRFGVMLQGYGVFLSSTGLGVISAGLTYRH